MGSPREAFRQLTADARALRFDAAGAALDVPAARQSKRAQLAKRLAAVI